MHCNCGALLPDDARFCHKCGKPQYEEDIARLEQEYRQHAPVPPLTPPLVASAPIGFHNRRAVAVSIAVAMLALFGFFLISAIAPAAVEILVLPLFCFAGFTAAHLYSRQTGEAMTPQSGARIGFMTALWAFLALMVLVTIVIVALSDPDIRQQIVSLASSRGTPGIEQATKLFENPKQFIFLMLGNLLVTFCLLTFPSMLGGMLGVKFRGKK